MPSDPDVYDIFISYAHVDNEPLPGADQGWVRTFVAGLKTYLGRALGRHDSARIWMDYGQLRDNHAVTPAIHGKLATVKLLTPFLSPGYLASRWCMQELETFLALHGADSGRIFPIRLGPEPRWPRT